MKITKTNRGFAVASFKDQYKYDCSIQESSLATKACVWLGLREPNPKQFPGNGTGWHDYKLPDNVQCTTRMHLTQRQVKALLPLLQQFVKTGKLQ